MCYRINRSSGRGIEVAQNLQKLRVGSVTLYPVPVPAPGYFSQTSQKSRVGSVTLYPYPYPLQGTFTDLTEVPGGVLNVLQN